MMGIFSLGFASCLANRYCSVPGFANPGNLIMETNAGESHSLDRNSTTPPPRFFFNASLLTLLRPGSSKGPVIGN